MPQKGCKKPRVSAAMRGRTPWNKGRKTGQPGWNRGVSPSADTIAKIAAAKRRCVPWNKGLTKGDPRVAIGEQRRREAREYARPIGRRESVRKYEAKRKIANPFVFREMAGRRRANQLGHYVERVDLRMVLERDGWICGICGGLVSLENLSFDHIRPLSLGGAHTAENLQVCHLACNSRKGAEERRLAALLKEEAS